MLKNLLSNNVKTSIAIDDFRLKTNLIKNQILLYNKKSFFYTMLGFDESHSGVLGDVDGFLKLIPCVIMANDRLIVPELLNFF